MATSIPFHFTTNASAPAAIPVRAGQTCTYKGLAATNGAAYAVFIKFYWFPPTASTPAPVVGTTVPNMTIQIPTPNGLTQSFVEGVVGNGPLWVAVTKLAADNDTTAVAAGDAVITLLLE